MGYRGRAICQRWNTILRRSRRGIYLPPSKTLLTPYRPDNSPSLLAHQSTRGRSHALKSSRCPMPDKLPTPEAKAPGETPPAVATPPVPPRRSPGHRGADVRDTVAEMAAKAQEISQEAGSKMAAAMKDVINAAAGIAGFAVESARDLV